MALRAPLLGVITALALAACGGGNNETLPPRTADVRFGDMQALKVSRVSVSDQNNKELYAANLDCSQSFNCRMQLQDYKPPQQLSFKFYDQGNQLVSASDLYDTNSDEFFVPNSDTMLGAYLFRKYTAMYGVPPLQFSVSLSKFFQNTANLDNTPDSFNELGRLYQKVRQDPALGYGETQFLAELKKRLDSGTVLSPSYLRTKLDVPVPVRALAALKVAADSAASCPAELQVIAQVASDYGQFIPYVGDAVGTFIGKAFGAVVNGACDESGAMAEQLTAANQKLDEIKKQLQELDAKIVAMGYTIDEIKKALDLTLKTIALAKFSGDYDAINSYLNRHNNLLHPSGKQPYTNLNDYVQKSGGLKESNFPSDTSLRVDLLSKLDKQNELFKGLALQSNLEAFAAAFEGACANESKITGDVLQQRALCNLLLARITAQFSDAQSQLALVMKDQIFMISQQNANASATDKAWIDKTFTSPFAAGWGAAQAEVNAALTDNLTRFGRTLGNSFVAVNKGLPTNVKAGLSFSASCRSEANNEPAISEWYANVSDKYVVVYCYNDGRMVKSKFYYDANDEASLYKNILGVPVVVRTSSPFTDRSTPWFTAGYNVALGAPTDPAMRGLAVKVKPKEIKVNNEPFPPKWIMSPKADYQYTESYYSQTSGNTSYDARFVMLRDVSLTDSFFEYFSSRYNTPWTGESYLASTLAYTVPENKGVDSGSTLVWQVELTGVPKSDTGSGSFPFKNDWRLRCLTADCSVEGDHLVFKNNSGVRSISLIGPKDGWKSFVISR
jgi:hypothetical protein